MIEICTSRGPENGLVPAPDQRQDTISNIFATIVLKTIKAGEEFHSSSDHHFCIVPPKLCGVQCTTAVKAESPQDLAIFHEFFQLYSKLPYMRFRGNDGWWGDALFLMNNFPKHGGSFSGTDSPFVKIRLYRDNIAVKSILMAMIGYRLKKSFKVKELATHSSQDLVALVTLIVIDGMDANEAINLVL